jgi:hypothetical protein
MPLIINPLPGRASMTIENSINYHCIAHRALMTIEHANQNHPIARRASMTIKDAINYQPIARRALMTIGHVIQNHPIAYGH